MSIDLKIKTTHFRRSKKGILPKTKMAENFDIPKTTLSTIVKNKNKIDEIVTFSSNDYENLHENIKQELL